VRTHAGFASVVSSQLGVTRGAYFIPYYSREDRVFRHPAAPTNGRAFTQLRASSLSSRWSVNLYYATASRKRNANGTDGAAALAC